MEVKCQHQIMVAQIRLQETKKLEKTKLNGQLTS